MHPSSSQSGMVIFKLPKAQERTLIFCPPLGGFFPLHNPPRSTYVCSILEKGRPNFMLIRNCLTPLEELVTVTPETPMREVIRRLMRHSLESIPVVDRHTRFLGVTGYGNMMKSLLREGIPPDPSLPQPVAAAVEKMDTVHVDSDFEEVLPVIVRHPFVPIVEENGTFLGIAKISDIESALTNAFGTPVKGVRLLVGVFIDQPHVLERLLAILKPFDVNIISLTTFDAGDAAARRILLKLSPSPFIQMITESFNVQGFRVLSVREG